MRVGLSLVPWEDKGFVEDKGGVEKERVVDRETRREMRRGEKGARRHGDGGTQMEKLRF
jgi:hypothetical protein